MMSKAVKIFISPNISFLATEVESGCVAGQIWERRRRSVNSVPDVSDRQPVAPAQALATVFLRSFFY